MRHLFLINPAAGKGNRTEAFRANVEKTCKARNMEPGKDYEIKVSQKPGDITARAREESQKGQELRIYACGGDGTLNETVNGAAGYPNVAVTHVPCGSGNDFIRLFDKVSPFLNLESLLDHPKEIDVDLISCNGSYAMNVCSMGFDARIGTEIAEYKKMPLVKGSGAYLVSALVNTIKGVHHHYRVEVENQVFDGELTMIYAGNGSWYGGGFHPVPDADPTDGLLDVLLVKGVSRFTVLRVIGSYKVGKFRDYPNEIRYFRTNKLKIICDKDEAINLDGELEMGREVEISVAPFKMRFFYPQCVNLQRQADEKAVHA